jgi:hypothetical protein
MEEKMKKETFETINIILLVVLTIFVISNSIQLNAIKIVGSPISTSVASVSAVIPTGVPKIYGSELKVSFDDITPQNPQLADATIAKLANLDQTLTLDGSNLQRYIKIGGLISCEYCCGAASIIFTKDTGQYKAGDAACGCAHSYAMRGVAKYLIKNHPTEFTDDQILEELGKWKVLFFPDIHVQKAAVLKEKGIEMNYINLASNKYRGIEQGASSGAMIGGC